MIPHTLHGLTFVERFYSLPSIDSTNTYAKNVNSFPQTGIYVVQADRQLAGKGRQGNSFFSDVKGGLWVSLIVPVDTLENHFAHNRAISLAISESLLKFFPDSPVKIKWPNDIYWKDKKICGILLENIPSRTDQLIVGFGLNVNLKVEDFPEEFRTIATSVYIETGKTFSLGELLRSIVVKYREFATEPPDQSHARYSKLLYNEGAAVCVDTECGIFRGVDPDGALLLDTGEKVKRIQSGTLHFAEQPK